MKAYEVLSSPEKWIKGDYAVDTAGEPTYPDNPKACKWCCIGAIARVYEGPDFRRVTDELVNHIRSKYKGNSIPNWNDAPGRTYEEVVNTLRLLDI